jgi:hypothetical protein
MGNGPMEVTMRIDLQIQPLVALVAGIVILLFPRLLKWIVGIYLVAIGALGLLGR